MKRKMNGYLLAGIGITGIVLLFALIFGILSM